MFDGPIPGTLPLLLLFGVTLPAQCGSQFLPGDPVRDVVGRVDCIVSWDPDGAGPATLAPTIGGDFAAGNAVTSVAWHDGTQWHAVGTPPARVSCLAMFGGQLVAGCQGQVALWNGSAWQTIGTTSAPPNVTNEVRALATYQGLLIAAGSFTSIDGIVAANLAAWNGSTWSPLGAGTNGRVQALAVFNGSLHVGGSFAVAGGIAHHNYGIWNGTGWAASPDFDAPIAALAARVGTTLTNSFLFAGGSFTAIGAAPNQVAASRLARFSPSTNTWSDFNSGSADRCMALLVRSTGLTSYEVLSAHSSAPPAFGGYVRRWSGGTWSQVGGTLPQELRAIAFVGGGYTVATSSGLGSGAVQRFDGTAWQSVTGPGIDRAATAVCDGGGDVVLADATGVQRGGPGAWTPMPGLVGTVRVLARMANGDIVAGGVLSQAGGVPTTGIARWNGSTWSALGGGIAGEVEAVLPLPNGELLVGGSFAQAGGVPATNLARWTGAAWQPFGGGTNDRVRSLVRLFDGSLVVGGDFTTSGAPAVVTPRIARWTGTAWQAMTSGTGFDAPVHSLTLHPSGPLLAGGAFTVCDQQAMQGLARWNGGTSWTSLSVAPMHRVLAFGSGDLVASPLVATPETSVLLRLGAQVTALISGPIADVQPAANGDVLVAGSFAVAGGVVSQGFARYTSTCPATVTNVGAGCAGTTLTVVSMPYTGGVHRATASGLPTPAFAFHVLGFAAVQPALPLVAVLPQALPGCLLHASPDVVELAPLLVGDFDVQLAVPTNISLNGTTFFEQVVAMQVGPGSSILAVTASNAFRLTVGVF